MTLGIGACNEYHYRFQPAKQPMFIHRLDGEPLAVAGLWTTWRDKTAGPEEHEAWGWLREAVARHREAAEQSMRKGNA